MIRWKITHALKIWCVVAHFGSQSRVVSAGNGVYGMFFLDASLGLDLAVGMEGRMVCVGFGWAFAGGAIGVIRLPRRCALWHTSSQ